MHFVRAHMIGADHDAEWERHLTVQGFLHPRPATGWASLLSSPAGPRRCASFDGGQSWQATVDVLDLFESPTEESQLLAPVEIVGGYCRQVGVSWDGGRLVATGSQPPEARA